MNNRYPKNLLLIIVLLSGWQSITITARMERPSPAGLLQSFATHLAKPQ